MNAIETLKKLFNSATQQPIMDAGNLSKQPSNQLNDVVNFRINKDLKEEFSRICKADQSTMSREIKRFMQSVVERGKI